METLTKNSHGSVSASRNMPSFAKENKIDRPSNLSSISQLLAYNDNSA